MGVWILGGFILAVGAAVITLAWWKLGDQWAVREGDWKLVVNANDTDRSKVEGDDKVFLSNLGRDVSERNNLAAKHRDVVEKLTKLHESWAAEVGAGK